MAQISVEHLTFAYDGGDPLFEDVCFSIEDNGTGIHEDDLYYIFNRFYRSRHSNDGAGIGLGLPLTKAIIENQKGIIEVESQLGKGTVFSVYLPIPTKVQD